MTERGCWDPSGQRRAEKQFLCHLRLTAPDFNLGREDGLGSKHGLGYNRVFVSAEDGEGSKKEPELVAEGVQVDGKP